MKDSKLEREANQIISDLIAKIEQLEDKNTELEEEVDSLNRENDDLANDIARKDEEIGELKFDQNVIEVKREQPDYQIN